MSWQELGGFIFTTWPKQVTVMPTSQESSLRKVQECKNWCSTFLRELEASNWKTVPEPQQCQWKWTKQHSNFSLGMFHRSSGLLPPFADQAICFSSRGFPMEFILHFWSQEIAISSSGELVLCSVWKIASIVFERGGSALGMRHIGYKIGRGRSEATWNLPGMWMTERTF